MLRYDVVRWGLWRHADVSSPDAIERAFSHMFPTYAEFRSLTDYRIKMAETAPARPMPDWKRATDLYIACDDIGPGFQIQHGHSTWVYAERIGRHFHVNQNVTIGVDKGRGPLIGDNVQVSAGAVVVGPITIGNNVTIAPNAFVNFDVPDDSVVFPARSVIVAKKPPAPAPT